MAEKAAVQQNTTQNQSRNGPVGPDTLISVKVVLDGQNRRFKIPLRDLGAHVLPQKLRTLLAIPADAEVKFDRFSDSAGAYVTLDSEQAAIYKQLYRAAKAKLKLRLRATVTKSNKATVEDAEDEETAPKAAASSSASATATATAAAAVAVATTTAPSTASSPTTASASATATGNATATAATAAAAAVPPSPPRSVYLQTVLQPPVKPICSIPGAFNSTDSYLDPPPRPAPRSSQLSQPTLPSFDDFCGGAFSIDCNHCGQSVPNEHFHCSICDNGDFDLCKACLDSGVTCDGDDHWLIKRTIQNGFIMASVTDTCRRKSRSPAVSEKAEKPASARIEEGERTCNSCIKQLPAVWFVTCTDCPDFDLCKACFVKNEHGHHPGHVFEPVDKREEAVSAQVKEACRGHRHDACCDGCNKAIAGVRHKCLSCPDWDFCSECIKSASTSHPGHRFAPLYESIDFVRGRKELHFGVYCDGPLCDIRKHRAYIRGDRYKCSICHDTDFCANCEAHPLNRHSATHPMIKMRTPFRQVSIQTIHDHGNSQGTDRLGDRPLAKNASTETVSKASTIASTQLQTMAECKPVEDKVAAAVTKTVETAKTDKTEKKAGAPLQAFYECDSTPDGTTFGPNRIVSQSWTLRNPGPTAWPAGCAVYYIGGDDMRNLDVRHPSSVSTMTAANRSNILEHGLEPGKTAVFTVLLRSPAREGRAISYWRLKSPDGTPFGHKLWVDINVKSHLLPIELPIRSAMPPPTVVDAEDTPERESVTDKPSEEGSQMIFPKLDKESPMSSIHEAAAAAAAVEKQTPTEPAKDHAEGQAQEQDDQDLWEGVESLDLEEESEEELLNDEEYDILDASDEDEDLIEMDHK